MSLKTLLLDISGTSRTTLKTGIERVAQSLMLQFLQYPPKGYRVIPVHLCPPDGNEPWKYVYASDYLKSFPGLAANEDRPLQILEQMDFGPGDHCLVLDISGGYLVQAVEQGLFSRLRTRGVLTQAIVYDLLPLQYPDFFPKGSTDESQRWYRALLELDGVVAISQAVEQDFRRWYETQNARKSKPFSIQWFHLGADFENAHPSVGVSVRCNSALLAMANRPTFLMVGTLEPRKGYLQAIAAFSQLWEKGVDVNLVIVGKEGWTSLPGFVRQTIPQIIRAIGVSPELGKRFFWLEEASDEALELLYAASHCVVLASEAEGFGLPIIEAAHHGLPLIVRDIPVFREVAGSGASYFSGLTPQDLAAAIEQRLVLSKKKTQILSGTIVPLSWQQSAAQLWEKVSSLKTK
jgi:glycosyltransferase involved in cell wall biosynthesis